MRFIRLKAGILALCLAAITCCNTALAQVTYRLHRVPLSGTSTSHYGMNNMGLLVGSHTPGGIRHGYVYDHYGLIDFLSPRKTYTLTDLITVPDEWNSSNCLGLNDMGQVVGLFERTTEMGIERVGFLLDLDIFSETPTPSWRFLPTVPGALSSYGRRINNHGLVLIEEQGSGVRRQFIYDSSDINGGLVPLDDSINLLGRFNAINDYGQLVTGNSATSSLTGVRLTLTPGLGIQDVKQLSGVEKCQCINESGDLGLTLAPIKNSRGKVITPRLAARYSDELGLVKLSTIISSVVDINDSGDVLGYNGTPYRKSIYTDEHGWLRLDDLVTSDDPDDVAMWFAAESLYEKFISNRDATGFGTVFAFADHRITTGNGKNAVTTYVRLHFLLVPELP